MEILVRFSYFTSWATFFPVDTNNPKKYAYMEIIQLKNLVLGKLYICLNLLILKCLGDDDIRSVKKKLNLNRTKL